MATSAAIQFNGNTGVYNDLICDTICTLTNVDNTDITTWLWTIISKPEGSSTSLTGATTNTATFTPDITGTYLINLNVNQGLLSEKEDEQPGSLKTVNFKGILPGGHETIQRGADGWKPVLNNNIRTLDLWIPRQPIRGFNDSGGDYSQDDVLFVSSYDSTKSLYPLLLKSSATSKPTGIATGTIVNGKDELIQTYDKYICHSFNTTSADIGDPVYADYSGGLTLSRTQWVIGYVIFKHATNSVLFLDFQDGAGFFVDFKYLPIEWAEDGAVAPAVSETIIDVNGKIRVRKFDDAVSEDVVFPWDVPDNIWTRGGVTFYAQLLITEGTAPSSEKIACALSGYCRGDGDSLNGTFGTEIEGNTGVISDAQYDLRKTIESEKVTITDLAGGEMAMLKFYRDHDSVNDNYGQDIGVTGIKLFFTRKR